MEPSELQVVDSQIFEPDVDSVGDVESVEGVECVDGEGVEDEGVEGVECIEDEGVEGVECVEDGEGVEHEGVEGVEDNEDSHESGSEISAVPVPTSKGAFVVQTMPECLCVSLDKGYSDPIEAVTNGLRTLSYEESGKSTLFAACRMQSPSSRTTFSIRLSIPFLSALLSHHITPPRFELLIHRAFCRPTSTVS